MAIAGLLLFAGTLYFPSKLQIQSNEEYIQTSEEINILKADLKFAEYKESRLRNIITNTIALQQGQQTISSNKMELVYSDSEIKQMKNEIVELLHQNDIGIVKIAANELREDYVHHLISLTRIVQAVLGVLSGILISWGFRLWYFRIQKHIDKQVKNLGKPANIQNS